MDEKLMSIVVGIFAFPLVILEIIKEKLKKIR
jgi:hypothetical protein